MRTGQSDETYNPYAESLQGLIGTTESLYQAANELDPALKYELRILAENNYGYLAGKGVQMLLSDSELGQTLRATGEIAALSLLDLALNWVDDNQPKVSSYALMPCSVNGDYALMRSYGSLSQMVSEVAQIYTLSIDGINERYESLEEITSQTATEDIDLQMNADPDNEEEVQAVYEMFLRTEPLYIRMNVLEEKRTALIQDQQNVIESFLSDKGITDFSMDSQDSNYYADLPSMSQYLYYIMNSDNKISWCFLANGNINAVIGEDGTCSIWYPDYAYESHMSEAGPGDASHVIVDKNGKILYQDELKGDRSNLEPGSVLYHNISPSGNVLRQTVKEDFEHGTYSTIELVTPDGETIPVLDDMDSFQSFGEFEKFNVSVSTAFSGGATAYSDLIGVGSLSDLDAEYVVDMATGEVGSANEFFDQENEPYESFWHSHGLSHRVVNDEYVMNYHDNTLYDYLGNPVADLSAGEGPQESYPFYDDGHYWVVTNTGYFYVLDEDLNQTLEPVKMGDNVETKVYPGYGLGVFDPAEHLLQIYQPDGEILMEISKDDASESWASGSDGWDEFAYDYICGNNTVGWFNMKKDTSEILMIPDYSDEIATLPAVFSDPNAEDF